jgi:WD40 repeat protein
VAACLILLFCLASVVSLVVSLFLDDRSPRAKFYALTLSGVWLSPDGRKVAVLNDAGTLDLRDAATGVSLVQHAQPNGYTALAFGPGGAVSLGRRDGWVESWTDANPTRRSAQLAPGQPITALAHPPGADGLVAGWGTAKGAPGEVAGARSWNPQSGRLGPPLKVAGLLSPDGRTLLERAPGGLRLWGTARAVRRADLPVRPGEVTLAAFSPDGSTLACAGKDGSVRLFDVAGKAGPILPAGAGPVARILFGPSGTVLTQAERVKVWDGQTGKMLGDLAPESRQMAAFAPDGSGLIAHAPGNRKGTQGFLCLLEPASGQQLFRVRAAGGSSRYPEDQRFVAASADGATILTRDWDSTKRSSNVCIWDRDQLWRGNRLPGILFWASVPGSVLFVFFLAYGLWTELRRWRAGWRGGAIRGLAFRPDGKAVLACGADGVLRLWDLLGESERLVQQPGESPLLALAFVGPAEVATIDEAGRCLLRDVDREEQRRLLFECGTRVGAAAFSPDGRVLATASTTGRWGQARPILTVWEVLDGRVLVRHTLEVGSLRHLTVAPGGRACAALSDRGLLLWTAGGPEGAWTEHTLATSAELLPQSSKKQQPPDRAPAFTPDGKTLLFPSTKPEPGNDPVTTFFFPDRKQRGGPLAWDVATAQPWAEVRGPTCGQAFVFGVEGRELATINANNTVSLWAPGTGQELVVLGVKDLPAGVIAQPPGKGRELGATPRRVQVVAFSADGAWLAFGDARGGVAWCDLDTVKRAGARRG